MSISTERAKALLEVRAGVWNEQQTFLEGLKGREMSAEERTQFDRYNERMDSLGREVDEMQERAQREDEAAKVREAQSQAFGREPDEKRERIDMNKRILSWMRGEERFDDFRDEAGDRHHNALRTNIMQVARERDLVRQGATPDEIRALAWDTGSSASAVPTILDRSLYEVMEANISMLRMPVRRIVTAGGEPMDFPTLASHAIATQVAGQGTTLAGTDPVFGKITLTPVKYGELIKVASEVVTDSGIDMVAFVARDLGYAIGRKVNDAEMAQFIATAFVGSGGTVATGGSLLTPDYEDLVNLAYSVNDSYRESGSAAWVFNNSTAGTLRKLRDGNGGTIGAPIWQPSVQTGVSGQRQPDTLLGYPVYIDKNVAAQGSNAKVIFFGDLMSYYLRLVGDPIIERNDSVGFATDEVYFRGKWRSDSAAADTTAINLLKMSVS